jgi:hypothetical protein
MPGDYARLKLPATTLVAAFHVMANSNEVESLKAE